MTATSTTRGRTAARLAVLSLALLPACASSPPWALAEGGRDWSYPEERGHLTNMRRMTAGQTASFTHAEAYWSHDDTKLVLQCTRPGEAECDQIYVMDVETAEITQLTNAGRTTCSFFLAGDERIVYASTHLGGTDCPPKADRSAEYVWDVYTTYDLFTMDVDGGDVRRLTDTDGYDAEATVGPDGRIVFTSKRSGDLELWTMDADGGNLHQVTDRLGYDGGAFFSHSGEHLVWRATRFDSEAEKQRYRELLADDKVTPGKMELWIAKADGSELRQLTDNGAANFAPFFTPDDTHIVFSSNMDSPTGFGFDLYMMPVEGGEPERLTWFEGFDSFPMFTRDGTGLVFTSGRGGNLDVYVADWTP